MDIDPTRELRDRLNELEGLAKKPDTSTPFYSSLTALSHLASEGMGKNWRRGWASEILDSHGDPLFNKDEAASVESLAAVTVKPMVAAPGQKGGAVALREAVSQGLLQFPSKINLDDISLDKSYWAVNDYFAKLDQQTRDFSRTLGPFRFFYETPTDMKLPLPVPIPVPPFVMTVMVPVPSRAIPVLIGTFVEGLRIFVSILPLPLDIVRKILSVVLSIIDLLKGEWKHALLSFAGYFGRIPMVLGIMGKVWLNALSLVAPDLQEKLMFDLWQAKKSMLIGFFLWGFATFAPDFVRSIVRKQFDMVAEIVKNANAKIGELEDAMQKSVDPLGIKIKFKDIPESFVPSFDDIQNLQAIARQPAIMCSREFQQAIEPLRSIPPIRIVLELMSIPTDAKSLEMVCGLEAGDKLVDTLKDAVMPEVTMK
jgi:hypothetical protein